MGGTSGNASWRKASKKAPRSSGNSSRSRTRTPSIGRSLTLLPLLPVWVSGGCPGRNTLSSGGDLLQVADDRDERTIQKDQQGVDDVGIELQASLAFDLPDRSI